jgi:asparagine synthetase B (glutamine-hydrolysing)
MPGLFGWVDLDQDTARDAGDAPETLAEMARRMRHTGDEIVETWSEPSGGFTIARIAPGSLKRVPWPAAPDAGAGAGAGAPPRSFVDGVLHGDERHVTSRVRELACRGRAALASLCGFYTAARWDPAARRLLLAVDRRASRPLAFTVARRRLWFAPEVKALLAVPGVDKALDDGALGVFLGAGYLLAEQTLFAGIRRLAGGEVLVVGAGFHRVETWWRYQLRAGGDGTPARDLEAEMADLVRGAVERNLGPVDRAVVFLSGGVDSRAIAEAAQGAARRQGREVRTVTWAASRAGRGGSAGRGTDLEVAQRVARRLGTRHRAVTREVSAWGTRLWSVTYLLDGLTDVPAYHAYEYAVMRDLAAGGARVVLRGDECFGWEGHVGSLEEALLTMNLRRLGPLQRLDGLVRPAAYARWCEASAAALESAVRPFHGEHPDDAKDQLYFRHRLQGYLGSAAYLKHVTLDHRAPLVDEALLDLNGRVPAALRAHKGLFCRAAARGAPEVWRIPFARHGNMEDWEELLTTASPVREAVVAALGDEGSGVWELFDRGALVATLPALGAPPSKRPAAWVARGVKALGHAALGMAPAVERRIAAGRHRRGIRVEQILMRVMVLKCWHDLFVTGDGSRRALEGRLLGAEGR